MVVPSKTFDHQIVTLTSLLKQVAVEFSGRRALVVSGKFELTHARLQELVDEAATRLISSGVRHGDVVALTFKNTVEDALVADYISGIPCDVVWVPLFRRNLSDEESLELQELFQMLYKFKLELDYDDDMVWDLEDTGIYSVKSQYRNIVGMETGDVLAGQIFRWGIPPRQGTFLWLLFRNKIRTCENLRKRRIMIVSYCAMCGKNGEDSDHLFLNCEFVKAIWIKISGYSDQHIGLKDTMREFIIQWNERKFSKNGKKIWRWILAATVWGIWTERNRRIFENQEASVDVIYERIRRMVASWVLASKKDYSASFSDIWYSCSRLLV